VFARAYIKASREAKNGVGLNKYKYNGKELQEELGLNVYDYGARMYDPAKGRWDVMDKLSELYSGISPYSYTLNNPVLFIDPDGNYVDDSWIYAKHDGKQNKALIKAWETFAKSKEGIAFISNFAEKGQVIAGHKYTESGKFDKNNHDLNFGQKDDYADAQTDTQPKKGGGMQTTIMLSSTAYGVDGLIGDIGHEAFVHAESEGEDYLDDKKLNLSNLDKDVVKKTDQDIKNGYPAGYRSSSAEHYQEKKDEILNKRLLPILQQYYKNNDIKKNEKEIKKKTNSYAQ
jgi:RHS repeat-associated protein